MAQDNQNRDAQNPNQDQPENWQNEEQNSDQLTREGRGADTGSAPDPSTTRNQNPAEGADMDEMDEDADDEREDDDRIDGGQNRRRSIS